MKILMVTRESAIDKRYGLGKSLAPIIEELHAKQIEAAYLCHEDAGQKSIIYLQKFHKILNKLFLSFFKTTDFKSLSWAMLERFNMGRLAAKISKQHNYTHIHCHDPFIAAGYYWFSRFYYFHTCSWGLTEHGYGSYTYAIHEDGVTLGSRTMRWLKKREANILLKADWVISPTNSGKQQLARDLSLYPMPSTWHVIPHPLTKLKHYSKEQSRELLHWDINTIYIIAVGRFVELKNFSLLIKACKNLSIKNWALVLLGEGNTEPLTHLSQSLGISEQVIFTSTDNMGLYYSAADIYVSTSTSESFGLANLEALQQGLPSICTAVGGVAEVTANAALLIPPNDINALINALQNLIDNPALQQHLSQQAISRTKSWPDSKQIIKHYVLSYQKQELPDNPALVSNKTEIIDNYQNIINQWQACPLPKQLELPGKSRILVIVPHSDDEMFSCGGTLALLRQQECHIKVVILTDGAQGDPLNYADGGVINCRREESKAALSILGINDIEFFSEPDGNVQSTPELEKQILAIVNNFSADWIFTTSLMDYHRDHVSVGLSVIKAWQQRNYQERLFLFELWAPIPATWIVNISSVNTLKQKAVQEYKLPLKYCDYQYAVNGLSLYRGLYILGDTNKDAASANHAEAFIELESDSWKSLVNLLFSIRYYQETKL